MAERWNLQPELLDVITHHHHLSHISENRGLIGLVNLSDRMCRLYGLGYGVAEHFVIEWERDAVLDTLREEWPLLRSLNMARISGELQNYLHDVKKLVSVLYRL